MRGRVRTSRPKIRMAQLVRQDLRRAAHLGVNDSTEMAKDMTRQKIRSVRLGGLANAIGIQTSLRKKKTGDNLAWGALFARGGVNSRANQALMAYTEGAQIYPTGGRKWLAFPTKAAGRTVRLPIPRVSRGKAYGNFKNQPSRGPRLKFVPVNSKTALLILVNAQVSRKTGKASPYSGKKSRTADRKDGVVMFILIRFTSRMKRFDQQVIMRRAFSTIPTNIAKYQQQAR